MSKQKQTSVATTRQKGHATDLNSRAVQVALAQQSSSKRNTALLHVSLGLGLRAAEVAALTWGMLFDEEGEIGDTLVLPDWVAKKGAGGSIPLARGVKAALVALREDYPTAGPDTSVFVSQKTRKGLTRQAIVDLFRLIWARAGIDASSHSGRRYFITQAARAVSTVGGSLRDVQLLARHSNLATTQLYIAPNTKAQIDLVNLIGRGIK